MATHMLRNNADIQHIQAMLGHVSVQSTEIYTYLTIEDFKKQLKRLTPTPTPETSANIMPEIFSFAHHYKKIFRIATKWKFGNLLFSRSVFENRGVTSTT